VIARLDPFDVCSNGSDGPAELMAQTNWWPIRAGGAVVPLEDLQISAADRGGMNLDQDLVALRIPKGNRPQGECAIFGAIFENETRVDAHSFALRDYVRSTPPARFAPIDWQANASDLLGFIGG
jgi:hypothetical protein